MIKSVYLRRRFYFILTGLVFVFFLGIFTDFVVPLGIIGCVGFLLVLVLDLRELYGANDPITAMRVVADRLSNGDQNPVTMTLKSDYNGKVVLRVIDETPVQFQERNVNWKVELNGNDSVEIKYALRPVRRGAYRFGNIQVFSSTVIGLAERRITIEAEKSVKVYPSYLRLRHYAFLAFDDRMQEVGLKRVRRLGHTMEFEQIKEYVAGDDTRVLNWKATARTGTIMVNQFQDERAQAMYCVVDKGRLMQMPFERMTLLDYAINASLVMSYIAIHKSDKAGLITFADKVDALVKAGRRNYQMQRINEVLYNQQTAFLEADFERLYSSVTRVVRQRSLFLLMTNFESVTGLKRQLPYLRKIAAKHVLVVIFFENTELKGLLQNKASGARQIYHQTMAEKMRFEKALMLKLLKQYGIYGILTTPRNLTVDTINQYLRLKARGVV